MAKDNVDLILGGFQSAAQGLQPWANEQQKDLDGARAEKERQKPLSKFEAAIGEMMAGRLSPDELAVRIQHGVEVPGVGVVDDVPPEYAHMVRPPAAQAPPGAPTMGVGAPQPPPMPSASPAPAQASQGPSYGFGGRGGMQPPTPLPPLSGAGMNAPTPTYMPVPQPPAGLPPTSAVGPRAPGAHPGDMQQGTPRPPMPAPQTRGDMQTLQQAAPFLRATSQLSPEDRWLIEQMRDRTKRRGQDVVAGTADKNRDERARSSDERIELGYAQIDAGLQRAQKMIDAAYGRQSIGHGQNMELEALKLKVQEFTKRRAAQTSLLNSINNLADEPRVKEQLKADSMKSLESDWNDLEKELNTLQTRKSGAAPKTSVQTTRTSKGGGTAGANPVVKKVRVKNKKTGATGLMPENSPNLKPGGDYERI